IVTQWVMTLMLMTLVHFIAPSRFDGLPVLPVFTVAVAVTAVGHSLALRKDRMNFAISMALLVGSRLVPRSVWHAIPDPSQAQVVSLGLAGIAVAAIVNHRTLTRSSTAYKPQTALASPFGVAQTR